MERSVPEVVERAASWSGVPLSGQARAGLTRLHDWLADEAIRAGGLGPREGERLWERHLADSLSFARGWARRTPPNEILDVGSGVGLPGLPLALVWPECRVTLLDRGGRRVRLLRRIVRILALPNVIVAQGDAFAVADSWEGLVFRGAVTPPEAVGLANRLLEPGGTAVLGLSRRPEVPDRGADLVNLAAALGLRATIEEVPPTVLDAPAWLLIMTAGEPLP